MKYFRNYPLGLQLILFFLMVITLFSFSYFSVNILVPKITGITFMQVIAVNEHSPYEIIKTSEVVQGVLSVFIFLLPALIFAYLTHPDLRYYLGLRMPGKAIQFILVILMMLGAIPVLEGISGLISQIGFGADVKKSQEANDTVMRAYLTMPSVADFLRTFLVLAIIPAMGEEFFFRGIMMRFTAKITKSIWLSIVFTAALFALTHSNIFGLLSIFMAGALLAGVYYLTSSLWCSVLAHMVFNGSQVVLAYMGNSNVAIKNFQNSETIQWWLVGAGAIVFSLSFYLLWRNRTPLSKDWTADFDEPAFVLESEDEQQENF